MKVMMTQTTARGPKGPRFRAPAWRLLAGMGLLALTSVASAVETKVIRDDSFSQFSQGESTGTELLSDGFLKVAPEARRLDRTEEAVGWRVAVDRADGAVFFSTGHNGKVFRHVPGKTPELWAKLPEGQAISLAIDPTGGVLIGASPGGKIYRVVEAGKPQLLFDTKEQYIWDMIFDRDGVLYAATGPNGKIFRIRGASNGEVYYDSDATNIMALDFDRNGRLLAATQGRGMVLRVNGPNDAYVLYTSPDDEVRALASDQETGTVYAAVNGVRASSGFLQTSGDKDKPSGSGSSDSRTPSREPSSPSYLVEIQPSGFVTNFWPAPEAPIHAVLSDPSTSGVLVAAGKKGRLYRVSPNAKYSILADIPEPMVLSLAAGPDGSTWFTTANKASLYRLDPDNRTATFESRTLNAGSTVRWGNIALDAELTSGSHIVVETRGGNTPDPNDKTWSPYTTATVVRDRFVRVESPVAQYLQYRLTMSASPEAGSPVLDRIQVFYVERNAPPVLKSVDVSKLSASPLSALAMLASGGSRSPLSGSRPSGSSPFDSDDDGPGSSGPRVSALSRSSGPGGSPSGRGESGDGRSASDGRSPENSRRFRIAWNASDPNADQLLATLWIKGEDESVWRLLEEKLPVSSFTIDTGSLSDGNYRVRVEVSDHPENPDASATTASLVSELFTVDNSAPRIARLSAAPTGTPGEWEITAEAEDALSILASAEYAIDSLKDFNAVLPEDGVFDFVKETFRFRVRPDKPQPEHVLTLRVVDREGNTQVGKVLLR